MGFRAKIVSAVFYSRQEADRSQLQRERLSSTNLGRKSTIDPDTISTKTTPLGRSRTNSQASIPEYLRHTRSIPASLKTLFNGHSRHGTESGTLRHKESARTLGPASTLGGSHQDSLEAESPYPTTPLAEEKGEGVGAAVQGTNGKAGKEAQSGGLGEPKGQVEEEHAVNAVEQGTLTQPAGVKAADVAMAEGRSAEMMGSPVRSQAQEAHSYPPEPAPMVRPAVPSRKASQGKTKESQPPEERSRGLDISEKDLKPSTGFRMKMKLAWMGLKTKSKL